MENLTLGVNISVETRLLRALEISLGDLIIVGVGRTGLSILQKVQHLTGIELGPQQVKDILSLLSLSSTLLLDTLGTATLLLSLSSATLLLSLSRRHSHQNCKDHEEPHVDS